MSTIDEVYTLLQELEPDDAMSTTQQLRSLLQELADRRRAESAPTISLDDWYQKLPVVAGYIQCDRCRLTVEPDDLDIERHYLRKCTDKPTTYDERDMQKANIYIHDNGQQVKQEVNWWDAKAEKDLVERQAKADIARMNAEAVRFAADHFYKLRGQMVELGLLAEDASDQTAFIGLRDVLVDFAHKNETEGYLIDKTKPYLTPSNKV